MVLGLQDYKYKTFNPNFCLSRLCHQVTHSSVHVIQCKIPTYTDYTEIALIQDEIHMSWEVCSYTCSDYKDSSQRTWLNTTTPNPAKKHKHMYADTEQWKTLCSTCCTCNSSKPGSSSFHFKQVYQPSLWWFLHTHFKTFVCEVGGVKIMNAWFNDNLRQTNLYHFSTIIWTYFI